MNINHAINLRESKSNTATMWYVGTKMTDIYLIDGKLSVSNLVYQWVIEEPIHDLDGNKYDPKIDPIGFFNHLQDEYDDTVYVTKGQA
jgi:hypothetical protein